MNRPRWLVRDVVALGLVSLLTDASSEMILPLLPGFIAGTLGGGPLAIGLVDGIADGVAAVLKLFSGRLGDTLGRPRALVVGGYIISSFAKPLVAITMSPAQVLLVRVTDRIGKGIRTSPRDAVLAAAVDPADRGVAFGFHRSMDHAGAVIGPLVAIAILWWSGDQIRWVFAFAAIPAMLTIVAVVLGVGVGEVTTARSGAGPITLPPARLVRILVPIAMFALINSSDSFVLFAIGGERPGYEIPLLWTALHVTKMALSTPAGRLSDRIGRRWTIAAGWLVFAIVYAGMAFFQDPRALAGLFVVYGVHHALVEGAEKALVADLMPEGERGTAFGWYYFTVGFGSLFASVWFGLAWQLLGARSAPFLVAAVGAVIAAAVLLADRPRAM